MVCGGLWWFCGGLWWFVVVLWWFVVIHGGSWWFSVVVSWWFVVVCGGFSPKISRKRSCDPLFNQLENLIHYEISFLMRLLISPFHLKSIPLKSSAKNKERKKTQCFDKYPGQTTHSGTASRNA